MKCDLCSEENELYVHMTCCKTKDICLECMMYHCFLGSNHSCPFCRHKISSIDCIQDIKNKISNEALDNLKCDVQKILYFINIEKQQLYSKLFVVIVVNFMLIFLSLHTT